MVLYQCHNSREGCGFYLRGVSISFGDGSETFEVCLLRLGIDILGQKFSTAWCISCGGYIFDGGDYLKVEHFTVALYISREYG